MVEIRHIFQKVGAAFVCGVLLFGTVGASYAFARGGGGGGRSSSSGSSHSRSSSSGSAHSGSSSSSRYSPSYSRAGSSRHSFYGSQKNDLRQVFHGSVGNMNIGTMLWTYWLWHDFNPSYTDDATSSEDTKVRSPGFEENWQNLGWPNSEANPPATSDHFATTHFGGF